MSGIYALMSDLNPILNCWYSDKGIRARLNLAPPQIESCVAIYYYVDETQREIQTLARVPSFVPCEARKGDIEVFRRDIILPSSCFIEAIVSITWNFLQEFRL